MFVCEDFIAGLNDLIFHNREGFHNYIKQFEGFTVPESLSEMQSKSEPQDVDINARYQEFIKSFIDSLDIKYLEKDKNDKKIEEKKRRGRGNTIITFQIENHKLIFDNIEQKHFVTFDVMICSNISKIYFSQTYINEIMPKSLTN
jgi:hypothetical protein